MNRSVLQYLCISLFGISLSVLCSCASGQGTPPAGGPPDTTAPRILRTDPPNGSLNFSSTRISFMFSEDMNEDVVRNAIVITPIPKEQPSIEWSGTTLELTFQHPLLTDRTYAIAIAPNATDLSNNRLGSPYTLRFATGPTIDSGRISGQIFGTSNSKVYVSAYNVTGTALRPDSLFPNYITPVGDAGQFIIEAVPSGTYRVFAYTDNDGDLLYNPGSDAYGLTGKDVTLGTSNNNISGINIRLRPSLDLSHPSLYKATSVNTTRTELRFSEPMAVASILPSNFTVRTSSGTVNIRDASRSNANTLAVQLIHDPLPPGEEATVLVALTATDTAGNAINDSASQQTFRVSTDRDTIAPALLPLPFNQTRPYSLADTLLLRFNEPLTIVNTDAFVQLSDTLHKHRIRFRLNKLATNTYAALPRDTTLEFTFGVIELEMKEAKDFAGNSRDTVLKFLVSVQPIPQNGTLQGTITDNDVPNSTHVVQAVNNTSGKEYRLSGLKQGTWEFRDLPDGEYQVRAWRDTDNNGLYDYGSILPYRPAEAFTIWKGTLRVRPRWVTDKVNLVF